MSPPSALITALTVTANPYPNAEAAPMIRELNHRTSDGIEVTLLWNSESNQVLVTVAENEFGSSFMLEVGAEDALDAFHHPYAYSAQRRRDGALAA